MRNVRKSHPKRLTNRDYMYHTVPFRLFLNTVESHIDVHWHEFFELGFVISGDGEQILNGKHSPLTKGSLFLLTPADFHELKASPESPCVHYNLIFSDEAIKDELRHLLFIPQRESLNCHVPDNEFGRILADFERIAHELQNIHRAGASMIVVGTIERLLIELIRQTRIVSEAAAKEESTFDEPMQHAIAYLQLHFREPLSLEDAARQVNLSPNYFSSRFRQFTGLTFQRFLQNLRLHFARSLLKASSLPITDICFASGFNTLPHFERAFKAAFGQSPRSYRKKRTES